MSPGSSIRLVRGRGVGGSSAINAMMFLRGHRASSAAWENVGTKRWGCDDLLPYFKRSETVVGGDPSLRGDNGPMRVAEVDPPHPVIAAGLDAAVECGHRRANDISGGLEIGFGPSQQNIVEGKRLSAGPNLHLLFIDSTGIGLPGDDGSVVGYVIAAGVMQPFSRGSVLLSGPG